MGVCRNWGVDLGEGWEQRFLTSGLVNRKGSIIRGQTTNIPVGDYWYDGTRDHRSRRR